MTDKECIATQKASRKRHAKVHSMWNTESARIFFIQTKKTSLQKPIFTNDLALIQNKSDVYKVNWNADFISKYTLTKFCQFSVMRKSLVITFIYPVEIYVSYIFCIILH